MSNYYLDSSALLKRYLKESGTEWVKEITSDRNLHSIVTSHLTLAEVAAVFASKSRAPGGISQRFRQRILSNFLEDCDELFVLIPVHRFIINRAIALSQQYRLRGYDSVQLATALTAQQFLPSDGASELIFVAGDKDLLAAAQSEGLRTINPATRI